MWATLADGHSDLTFCSADSTSARLRPRWRRCSDSDPSTLPSRWASPQEKPHSRESGGSGAYAACVKHAALAPGQLDGMAGHIAYEVEMLALTSRELLARGVGDLSLMLTPSDADRLLSNILVESFLLHARSIDDFLTCTHERRRKGDVVAIDYNDEWVPSIVLAASVRTLINRRVAHITLDRLVFLVGVQPAIISRRLLARYREFAATLPAQQWPALNRAASAAGEHLDQIRSLERSEFVVSTTTQTVVTNLRSGSPYFATGHTKDTRTEPHS